MKSSIICFVLILTLINCSQQKKVNNGTYSAFFYETEWHIHISENTFIYESSGHLGGPTIKGDFMISGDTIILLTDSTYYTKKFLIDGDSCLIDVEVQVGYCKRGPDEFETRWRDINYPQLKTSDRTTIDRVLWMLEAALNGKEILEYFPDTTKSIVVQEYFELNKHADLHLKSHGTEITFLTANEIKERRIDEYLVVDDVRLGVETGMVDFQVMPEFSISILEFFEKINGQWTHLKR